jgi:hypothetical protein
MTDENYVTDPLAVQVINYLASKDQIDPTRWLAPKLSGISAITQAMANVQARADQRRRASAEEEVAKVLETRDIKDLIAYHLAGGSGDTEPSEAVPLNSAVRAVELQDLLDGT